MSTTQTPLLTIHLFNSEEQSNQEMNDLLVELSKFEISIILYKPNDALQTIHPKHPHIFVSIGSNWNEFTSLATLPTESRKRWLHFESPTEIIPNNLFYCWLKQTDPFPFDKPLPPTQFTSEKPLVSIFTASYRSQDKIKRPYHSLLNQTYSNWEWIIVDDSGDDDETYNNDLLPLKDSRIRRYRQDQRNGYIGAIKRYAAGLCTGEILVEVDHDDELTPDCLEKIVQAFQQNPDCGFAAADFIEVFEGTNDAHWYGWDCGFGYNLHYRTWMPEMDRWQNVHRYTTINRVTISHLVGLPNHPRAWTRDCYHHIGGHREELLVADDYDMLVRTFLCTKFLAIPEMLYTQFRNKNGNNSTFIRNNQIQILVKQLYHYYYNRIEERMNEFGIPEAQSYNRIWETSSDHPLRKTAHITHENNVKKSIIFPIPYSTPTNDHVQLAKTLQKGFLAQFTDIEVVVIGRVPEMVEAFASQSPRGAIRWWSMEPTDSLESCIEYAKLCSSCSEKIIVLPDV